MTTNDARTGTDAGPGTDELHGETDTSIPTTAAEVERAYRLADLPSVGDVANSPADADRRKRGAELTHPPAAVGSDRMAVPDPNVSRSQQTEVLVPRWILAAATYQIAHREAYDTDDPTPADVIDELHRFVHVDPQFRTPDGRDAVAEILAAAEQLAAASDGE